MRASCAAGIRLTPVIDARDSLSSILAVEGLLDPISISISTSLGDIVALIAQAIRTEEEIAS
ncbi:MAG: hypothetical protein AMXMBFR6_20690 [Betaproteobacteria bacterium]